MSSKKTLTEIPYKAVLDTFENIPTEQFTGAHPFPHIVLDGLFDGDTVKEIHKQFRELPSDYWQKNNDQGIEVKWRSNWSSEYDIPQPAREMVQFLNSGIFLRELSRLTGIPHLIPDPYYTGGGFNLIQRGGYLDVHADGNWHDAMEVHRRLNLILYLNSDWQEEWGGALNFYDADAKEVEASVFPVGNRLVVFETHDYSYHGHPEPVVCPEGEGRTSIILYYYTSAPRPGHQISEERPHSALWRSKGWTDKRGQKSRA
jgi:Rps23 Pro-64 3,4-dihydroxylase Tpa1-like proline 4-hydroxylase